MNKIINYFKIATDTEEGVRSQDVIERFNKIIEKYLLSSTPPNIKSLKEAYHNLSDLEKENVAEQISKIDYEVFTKKYPDEGYYLSADYDDIVESFDSEREPYGFIVYSKNDSKKICGYIYGSNLKYHADMSDIRYLLSSSNLLGENNSLATYKNDIISSFKTGKIFYVENLATTSECKSGLMPVGSILMIEMIKEIKEEGYKYIYAEFLRDSYELIKAAVRLNIFSKLGSEIIFDSQALGLNFEDSRSKVIIKLL
jgi:ribosomal protein S18 acetylase RimI-like enzyme